MGERIAAKPAMWTFLVILKANLELAHIKRKPKSKGNILSTITTFPIK
jgi:hypothetical protein